MQKKNVTLHVFLLKLVTIQDIRNIIASDLQQFEQQFRVILGSDNALLNEIGQYIQTKQGKQMRPILVLLSAHLCHGVTPKTIDTAVALELLHTSSLVHDDVVDFSTLRRGVPTIHEKWSNKVAILTGDYLLSKVIATIAQTHLHKVLEIVSELGKSLADGELIQLHHNQSMWISEDCYFDIISKKTACLFAACMEAGAESSGCTMRQATALRSFGQQLGICFQIQDDVLDYSDSELLGKPTMSDIRDGKATLPLLIALQRAPQQEAEQIRHMAEQLYLCKTGEQANKIEQTIKTFVLRYDGTHYALQKMLVCKQKAIDALSCFHDSIYKDALLQLLDYSIHRIQ